MRRPCPPLRRFTQRALSLALSASLFSGAVAQAQPAGGSQGRIAIVRDTEIERLLGDYVRPVARAAGLRSERDIEVVIVNDRGFNAFVMDSRRIFITVGALLDSETPGEVIGVLAHETGHIAGGHLARLRAELANATTASILTLLLGAAAIAGAAMAGGRAGDLGQAAAGVAMGSTGIAQRTLLAYQRTEENSADRAAITYLNATRQSPRGMLRTFERLADQMAGLTRLVDPYAQSHPLPRERIANLRTLVEASPFRDAPEPPALQARHDMMRAKISGFLERPDQVMRRYSQPSSTAARYARAIATFRIGNLQGAVAEIDALIRAQPNNPYLHELKGQMLYERGQVREAIAPYRRAMQLSGGAALHRIGLGRALVGAGAPAQIDEAVRELERAVVMEPQNGVAHRFLAMAYGRKGDEGRAAAATAQGHFADGNLPYARQAAVRAQALLPRGSPGWLRADDILRYRAPRGG
jgi:predicted Zn-dependent protease